MAYDPNRPFFKIILLGNAGVGKTALFHRIKTDQFESNTRFTITIDNYSKIVKVDKTDVLLCLWDTAGVERNRSLTRNYYRNAHGVILVYNVTDPESLQALAGYIEDTDQFCPLALKFLVGNKTDLTPHAVTINRARDFADIAECERLYLTSAKTGSGVNHVIADMAETLLNHHTKREFSDSQNLFSGNISVNNKKENETACLC